MPQKPSYIQVILPLHLKWDPWYSADVTVEIGSRVSVRFSGKEYIGVVCRMSDNPSVDSERILPIEKVETDLEKILPTELEFWEFIADYYLTTKGDVYKMAYPTVAVNSERRTRTNKKLSLRTTDNLLPSLDLTQADKPTVALGWQRERFYEQCIKQCLEQGKDVLFLNPTASKESPAIRRELSRMARSDTPVVIEGSKSCLFLPFTKLGLIIVDNEHSSAYKHNASPRYNGRDAAIMLAGILKSAVILGTGTPSMETLLNIRTGKFRVRKMNDTAAVPVEVIDTVAEKRKHGMIGEYSRKLLEIRQEVEDNGGRYLEIESWNLRKSLGLKLERYDLISVLHLEHLLSRNDFRADEKAWQMLEELRHRCKGSIVVQSRIASHPVLCGNADTDAWLEERREFNLPPYTRLVEIRKPGKEQEIIAQHFLAKNAALKSKKQEILESTAPGCTIDVDPL